MFKVKDFMNNNANNSNETENGDNALAPNKPQTQQQSQPQIKDFQSAKPAASSNKLSTEKVRYSEKDLAPKYTSADEAINSILRDGEYYEDYLRAEKAGLLKSKEFVLTAIAQNYNRFYASETPKPSDWIDEEYLCAKISYFFDETKENISPEANQELGESLHSFLLKQNFNQESFDTVISLAKKVAKVNAVKISSKHEGDRLRESLDRFNSAFNSALNLAKEKQTNSLKAQREKATKLQAQKKELIGVIDNMSFEL